MSRARCARCGERLRAGAAFCPACGASLGGDLAERTVEIDLLGGGAPVPASGHEVVFERSGRGGRGKAIGAGVAAALAVAVGASVLSGGGGGQSAPTTTTVSATTTTAAPTTTTDATTTAATTTTTLPAPFRVGTPNMFGEPTALQLLVTMSSDLVHVDVDSGIAEVIARDVLRNDGSGAGIATSVGLVTNELNSGLPGLLRPGAAKAEPLVDIDPSKPFFGASYLGEGPPGRLWIGRFYNNAQIVGYVEPNAHTGFVELGSPPQYGQMKADGLGGIVFSAPGGVYRWLPGGAPERVSRGVLLDAVGGHMSTIECDERLACVVLVTHLVDGTSWRSGQLVLTAGGFNGFPALAPDGRHIALSVPTDQNGNSGDLTVTVYGEDATVVTFTAPSFSQGFCGPFGCQGPGTWATDGSWFVGIESSDTLWAWRAGLDAPVTARLPQDRASQVMTFNGLVYVSAGPVDGVVGKLRTG